MITIKFIRNISLATLFVFFAFSAYSQHWAIRPELLLTSTKGKLIENTSLYLPNSSVFYNHPDVSLSIDYNRPKSRFSLGIGTFSSGVSFQGSTGVNNGILGFLFPPSSLALGTGGGIHSTISYEHVLIPKLRSKWFLGGGFNCWIMEPGENTGADFFWGNSNTLGDSLFRSNAVTAGWHLRTSFVWCNRKQKEVMQFIVRFNGSFGLAQHTLISRYDLLSPENLPNQQVKYKLTGTSIQVGISKTLVTFQKRKK